MTALAKPFVLALAAGALTSITPAPVQSVSAETLAMLDPSRLAASLCGSKAGGQALRARLLLAAAQVPAAAGAVPLYEGMDKVHFRVSSSTPLAQRYFDQGLAFSYGFNHAAAIRAFREAQRLDPQCAMCWWGEAFAHGPNINAPMDPAALDEALAAVRGAQQRASRATPEERALIEAMARRYSADPKADRPALDAAYADAMLAVAQRYPAKDDIAVLAAEAAMDTHPWDYWEADRRTPKPRLGEAVQLVETVLKRSPDHPQASHLYIHLMENGPDPRRAEAAADRLAKPLVPGAGHLVHMPAHIYYRLGRWQDSMRANIIAARADEAFLKSVPGAGLYRYGYYPHNVHFIVTSAQMAGDMKTATSEARRLATILDPDIASQFAWIQSIHAAPYFAHAQVASPSEVLALAEPDKGLPYVQGMRHYARAVAFAQQRDRRGFDAELAALGRIRQGGALQGMVDQGVPAPELLMLAEHVARGRFALASGSPSEAVEHYRQAVAIEDKIPYMEPPYWYYPVRQSLGAALFKAGRYQEARDSFRAALSQAPNNGWALYGLAEAERALKHPVEAAAADAALRRAWLGDRRWLRMERL